MVGEIGAALASLKAAGEIAKAMIDLRDASAFQTKAIELQRQILAAQESALAANAAQTDLVQRIRDLEAEIVRLKDWDGEKQRYELKSVDSGAFVYMKKPGMEDGEPPHWLCANCYRNDRASILQSHGRAGNAGFDMRLNSWACPHCRNAIRVDIAINPDTPKTW